MGFSWKDLGKGIAAGAASYAAAGPVGLAQFGVAVAQKELSPESKEILKEGAQALNTIASDPADPHEAAKNSALVKREMDMKLYGDSMVVRKDCEAWHRCQLAHFIPDNMTPEDLAKILVTIEDPGLPVPPPQEPDMDTNRSPDPEPSAE